MVILLGGAPLAGKTFLADRLMKRLGVPYVSLDQLMMGIYRSDPACGFTPESDDRLIGARLWPMVREMIKTNIENSRGIIFEGVQLLPDLVSGLGPKYRGRIIARWICFSDGYIQAHYDAIASMRNAIEKRNDTIDDQSTMLRKNRELVEECRKFGQRYSVIEDDFSIEMERIEWDVAQAFQAPLQF